MSEPKLSVEQPLKANTAPDTMDPTTAISNLERFVVGNDDLIELERLIGRFNIFDALGVKHAEIRHSNFLAWLLDPLQSHGERSLFLRAILMDVMKSARDNRFPCAVSPIELEADELRGVKVLREWHHIDLLISCEEPCFVVAIENKITSGERGDQLARYRKSIEKKYGPGNHVFVFLTLEGDEPSDKQGDGWVPYSYADVLRVLTGVYVANRDRMSDDVRAFLNHYLRLLEGLLMEDPEVKSLCRKLYKNHREALDLIFQHRDASALGLLEKIEEAIEQHEGDWLVVHRKSKVTYFFPKKWLDWMPPIGVRSSLDQRYWIVFRFEWRKNGGFLGTSVWPTTDDSTRQKFVERLTNDSSEFRFQASRNVTSGKFTQLGRVPVRSWNEAEGPDPEGVVEDVRQILDELAPRVAKAEVALKAIVLPRP